MKALCPLPGDILSGLDRRRFLSQLGLAAAFFSVPGAFAEQLLLTPRQTEGPFYPDHLPLDTDNDLVVINDSLTPAVGEITWLSGRILDANGGPLRNATVEIWQCDANGVYLHSGSGNTPKRDKNFQGFGRFVTGSTGEYLFHTIKPVAYPGRSPHIHFMVKRGDRTLLTSQVFISGDPANARDGIYRSTGGIIERELVSAEWRRVPNSRIAEYQANFDIVLGVTPEDRPGAETKKG